MKSLFTILSLMIVFSPLKAQWYLAAEDGVGIEKIKYREQGIYNGGLTSNPVTTKSTTFHNGMFSIGAKFGYEFNPFVVELDGKLSTDLSATAGIYTGAILSLNQENNLSFTPLIGISLDHNFCAATRLQYKHFFLEANKTGNMTFYVIGVRCYVYE